MTPESLGLASLIALNTLNEPMIILNLHHSSILYTYIIRCSFDFFCMCFECSLRITRITKHKTHHKAFLGLQTMNLLLQFPPKLDSSGEQSQIL